MCWRLEIIKLTLPRRNNKGRSKAEAQEQCQGQKQVNDIHVLPRICESRFPVHTDDRTTVSELRGIKIAAQSGVIIPLAAKTPLTKLNEAEKKSISSVI